MWHLLQIHPMFLIQIQRIYATRPITAVNPAQKGHSVMVLPNHACKRRYLLHRMQWDTIHKLFLFYFIISFDKIKVIMIFCYIYEDGFTITF